MNIWVLDPRQPKQLIGDVPSQRSKETSFLNHGVEEAKIETQTLVSTKGEDTVDGFRLDVFFEKSMIPKETMDFTVMVESFILKQHCTKER